MDQDKKYNQLELAKILGQPLDPRKPYPNLVEALCETDSADPDEHVYYYDVLKDTDKVYVITSTGEVTPVNVTPDADVEFTFVDTASPEYYVKLTDLAKSKERVLARKKATINRALNAKELHYILSLIIAGCPGGNKFSLASGEERFNITHLVDMIDVVKDYGDAYVLLVSSVVEKDIILWNWNDNKNIDIFRTFEKLNVKLQRIPNEQVTIDGTPTDLIASNRAYLISTASESSIGRKPLLFVRRRLNDLELLGGVISESGEKPERLIFTSPNPMNVGGTRYLAVGLTGYEEVVGALVNPYAIAQFTRA